MRVKIKKSNNNDETRKSEAERGKALGRVESLENEIRKIEVSMGDHSLNYEELGRLYCQ